MPIPKITERSDEWGGWGRAVQNALLNLLASIAEKNPCDRPQSLRFCMEFKLAEQNETAGKPSQLAHFEVFAAYEDADGNLHELPDIKGSSLWSL